MNLAVCYALDHFFDPFAETVDLQKLDQVLAHLSPDAIERGALLAGGLWITSRGTQALYIERDSTRGEVLLVTPHIVAEYGAEMEDTDLLTLHVVYASGEEIQRLGAEIAGGGSWEIPNHPIVSITLSFS